MTGRPRTVSDADVFGAVGRAISEDGPGRLTVAGVADRLGVTAPAIRQRFGSKRDLLIAYAQQQPAAVSASFDKVAATGAGPLETLVCGLAAAGGAMGGKRALANNLALLHLDLTDPVLAAHAIRHSRALRGKLRDLIDAARQAGELDTTDPGALADVIYTTYNGSLVTWAIDGTGPLDGWIADRVNVVLNPHLPRSA